MSADSRTSLERSGNAAPRQITVPDRIRLTCHTRQKRRTGYCGLCAFLRFKSGKLSILNRMEYFLSAVIILLAVFFLYKMIMPSADPDMTLKTEIDGEKIITELAQKKNARAHSKGLSVKRILHALRRQHKTADRRLRELLPFERWLYDNHAFLIEQARAQKHWQHRYARLPGFGYPRLYTLCETIVKAGGGKVDKDNLQNAVEQFRQYDPLMYAEVNALQSMSAFALSEYCAVLALYSVQLSRSFARASLDAQHHRIDTDRISDDAYLYFLYQAVEDGERVALETLCADNGCPIGMRNERLQVVLAHYNGLIASAVTSLRNLPVLFSEAFTLSLSPIDKLFRTQAVHGYAESNLQTQAFYCRRVSRLAHRRRAGELSIATQAAAVSREENRDIAFALLDPPKGKGAMRGYIAAQWLSTLLLPLPFVFFLRGWGIAVYILALPIAYALVIGAFAAFFRKFFPRRFLPHAELKNRDDAYPTLITVPTLVAGVAEAEEAFRNLETLACANPQPRFRYCLLLDLLPDRNGAERADDAAVLERIRALYDAFPARGRSFVMVRARRRNGDGVWCGWEKKRGALIELNELLSTGTVAPDHVILGEVPPADFVITLDSDTMINCADSLVEIMAHPYNADVNVVGLSMRTENASAYATGFARLFSGDVGLHAYSQTLSDPANDLFGRGNFTGKGIYRVKEFHALTGAAFCKDSLLSHDFIEGAFAGYRDSDLFGMDAFPADFSAYLTRKLRWLRGDLQFLPFLKRSVRNMAGERVKNPLTPIDKHHIVSVTVFGLLPLVSLGLVGVAMFVSPFLLLLAFALPILSVLAAIRRSALRQDAAFVGETLRQLFLLAVLPAEAVYNARAMAVTFVRLIRKRNLMDWKVSAHYKGRVSLLACLLVGAAVIVLTAVFSLHPIYYALGALFLLSYAFDRLSARAYQKRERRIPALDALLKDEARRTWDYFAVQLTEENGYLPCDNFNQSADRWTRRTSPTDIGMGLLAVVSACILGILPREKADTLAAHMVTSIERAPKWNGHLYNWMEDLQLIGNRYVSTVDSGNLLACLHVAANFFPDLKQRIETLIEQTDMRALYDATRGLFYIGFDVSADAFDPHHYDLMGSESTTAYLAAIGGGNLDRRAWANLSRGTVRYAGKLLASWTGGLFEYLLSPIFYPYPQDGLFGATARNAVRSHIAYARKKKLPFWGISECQYTRLADDGTYGYRAFGVPEIALNGTDTDVTAPYGCLMAVQWAPKAVEDNLRRLIDAGGRGRYGFFESMAGNKIIDSYMSHHKGMALAAICNYLCDGALRTLTTADGAGRAACLLLSEPADFGRSQKRVPQPVLPVRPDPVYPVGSADGAAQFVFLSNGNYSVVLDEHMNGYAYMDGFLTAYRYCGDGVRLGVTIDGAAYKLRAQSYSAFEAVYAADSSAAGVSCTVSVGAEGETRLLRICNKSDTAQSVCLTVEAVPQLSADGRTERPFSIVTECASGYAYAHRTDCELPLLFALGVDGGNTTYYGSIDGAFGLRPQPRLRSETALTVGAHEQQTLVVRFCAAYSERSLEQAIRAPQTAAGERYAIGLLYAPKPSTSLLGSRLLSGRGETLPHTALPCVVLDGAGKALETRLYELAKLYRCGVPFETAIATPDMQAEERARVCVRRSGIETFGKVFFVPSPQAPPPTDWRVPTVRNEESAQSPPSPLRSADLPKTVAVFQTERGDFTADGTLVNADGECVLSDGETAVVCRPSGTVAMRCNGADVTAADRLPATFAVIGERDAVWGVEPVAGTIARRVEWAPQCVRYVCACNGLTATHTVSPIYRERAAAHTITVENRRKSVRSVYVMLAVHPAMPPHRIAFERQENAIAAYDTQDAARVMLCADRPSESIGFYRQAIGKDGEICRVRALPCDGGDPLLSYTVALRVPAGGRETVEFTVGNAPIAARPSWPQSCLTVETGDCALDLLFKRLPLSAYDTDDEVSAVLADCASRLYTDAAAVRCLLIRVAATQSPDGCIPHAESPQEAALRLVLGVCGYIEFTQDSAILDERIAYTERGVLQNRGVALREHCIQALLTDDTRARNVPLVMLRIIAIAAFLSHVRDAELRLRLSDWKKRLFDAVEAAWDGDWYLQGYSDGMPIGSADNAQHSMYLQPQALAAFCMPTKRARRAAASVLRRLWDRKQNLLFSVSPDGDSTDRSGQDARLACTFVRALYALHEPETAYELIEMLNPVRRGEIAVPRFRGAGDYADYMYGRCGAPLYRCLIEDMLGIRICGKRVTFAPALPKRMTRVVVRFPEWDITAEIDNTGEGNTWGVSVDGIRYNTDWIALGESLRGKKVKIVKMNV